MKILMSRYQFTFLQIFEMDHRTMRRKMGTKSSISHENSRAQSAIAEQLHHHQLSGRSSPSRLQALRMLRVHQ